MKDTKKKEEMEAYSLLRGLAHPPTRLFSVYRYTTVVFFWDQCISTPENQSAPLAGLQDFLF